MLDPEFWVHDQVAVYVASTAEGSRFRKGLGDWILGLYVVYGAAGARRGSRMLEVHNDSGDLLSNQSRLLVLSHQPRNPVS